MKGFNKAKTVYHEGHEEHEGFLLIRQKLFTTKSTKGTKGVLINKDHITNNGNFHHEEHEGHEGGSYK